MSAQRDLSIAYNKIGDIATSGRQTCGCSCCRFATVSPFASGWPDFDSGNAEWQRDLTVNYSKLASVFKQSSDTANALLALRQGQAILDRLAKLAPDNAKWRNDLAWFNSRIAELTKTESNPVTGSRTGVQAIQPIVSPG